MDDYISFIHSPVDRHWWCFYLLTIMNNAAVNICGQVFMWTDGFICLGRYLGIELLGYIITLGLTFLRIWIL